MKMQISDSKDQTVFLDDESVWEVFHNLYAGDEHKKARDYAHKEFGDQIIRTLTKGGDEEMKELGQRASESAAATFIAAAVDKHGINWLNRWLIYEGLEIREA